VVAHAAVAEDRFTVVHPVMGDPLLKKVTDPVTVDGDTVAVRLTGPTGGVGLGLTVTVVDEVELDAAPMTMSTHCSPRSCLATSPR